MTTRTVTAGGLSVGVTIHTPAPEADRHVAVLYLHGGGLLYGERDDLPSPYIHAFTAAGYTLLCMDYPLAPETPLRAIHRAVADGWQNLCAGEPALRGVGRAFLFGRSAGAYLALILAKNLRGRTDVPAVAGVLDFYGYYDMTAPFLSQPAPLYTAMPAVPERMVAHFAAGAPVTSGPKAQRFSLYVYARQQAAWPALLGREDVAAPECSLSAEDIAALPPLFITASTGDGDVPYRVSKTLSRQAPQAVMKTVYDLAHDFDRITTDPTGMEVYRACLAWMDARLA